MNAVAFALGLITLGLVKADVSHLNQNHHHQQQQQSTFVANNGQLVKQSFNPNGDASFSSRSFAGSPSRGSNTYYSQQQNSFDSGRIQQNSFDSGRVQQNSFDSGRVQQSSSCLDSNSGCVAPKFCYNGFIDRSAEYKAVRSASGKCFAPEVCCKFAQQKRNANYQDNAVAAAESTSEVLTKEGYVVRKPSNQYLPQYPEFKPQPSNQNDVSVFQPTRPAPRPTQPPRTQPPRVYPQPTQPRPIPQRPYQPQPSENRPVIQYDPAPIVIPVGCAAALNCTDIQYCTASGVISKSPVSLSPQQEMFRVPLTDCRNPATNQVGKCCRDPDYTDPWPVGRTGQYVPEELNAAFDSGAYKQEPSGNVPVRVRPQQDGYVVPQPSNNQQRLYLPPSSNRI